MRDLAELVRGPWKIRLHPAGRTLSEMKMKATQTVPRGKIVTSTFADNDERARQRRGIRPVIAIAAPTPRQARPSTKRRTDAIPCLT